MSQETLKVLLADTARPDSTQAAREGGNGAEIGIVHAQGVQREHPTRCLGELSQDDCVCFFTTSNGEACQLWQHGMEQRPHPCCTLLRDKDLL